MTIRRYRALVALAAAGIVLASPVAAASPAPESSAGIEALPEAELEDLATIAGQEGISLPDAIDRYGWHESFSALAQGLRDDFPGDYAGASVENGGWIAFRGTAPAAAADRIRTYQRPVSITQNKGFTEIELEDRVEKVHFSIWKRTDLVEDVTTGYDPITGKIAVEVQPDQPGSPELMNQLRTGLPAESANWAVDITEVERIEYGDQAIHGGGRLTTCTAGFTVAYGHAVSGVSTAGHCGNQQRWGDLPLTFRGEHNGMWGDLQWHSRNDAFSDDFYHNWRQLRDVARTGYPVTGQPLCRFGKTTGKHCDTVKTRYFCHHGMCLMIAMEHDSSAGGDSGGPWFFGTTAYGIHKGWVWIPFRKRAVFTSVRGLARALGVYVRTV